MHWSYCWGVVPTLGGVGGGNVLTGCGGLRSVVVVSLFSCSDLSIIFLVMAISASASLCTSELLLDLCLAAVAGLEAPIASAVRVVNTKSAAGVVLSLFIIDVT